MDLGSPSEYLLSPMNTSAPNGQSAAKRTAFTNVQENLLVSKRGLSKIPNIVRVKPSPLKTPTDAEATPLEKENIFFTAVCAGKTFTVEKHGFNEQLTIEQHEANFSTPRKPVPTPDPSKTFTVRKDTLPTPRGLIRPYIVDDKNITTRKNNHKVRNLAAEMEMIK